LADNGRPIKLHLIGRIPGLETGGPFIVHGFLDKRTPEGVKQLSCIMRQAAFLYVPTRQDCSPMVFSEANSFGVPVITTRTGGVPDVVIDGVNGHVLPLEETADGYA